MSETQEKPAKIEPRWHKHSTLTALRSKRIEIRKAESAIRDAEKALEALQAEARLLETEAAEWMKRDKTSTEVALYPDRVGVGERQVAVVFTLNSYGSVYDTAVEVVRQRMSGSLRKITWAPCTTTQFWRRLSAIARSNKPSSGSANKKSRGGQTS